MHEAVPAIASCGVSPIVRLPDMQGWMIKRKTPYELSIPGFTLTYSQVLLMLVHTVYVTDGLFVLLQD